MEWARPAQWRPRPARISWLARPAGLAGSARLAWSPRMGRQAVLVRAPVGGAALLRNHRCRRSTRNTPHRGRRRCGSASPPSRLVLVLGGSLRVSRLLGLLLRTSSTRARAGRNRPPSPTRAVRTRAGRRPGSGWRNAECQHCANGAMPLIIRCCPDRRCALLDLRVMPISNTRVGESSIGTGRVARSRTSRSLHVSTTLPAGEINPCPARPRDVLVGRVSVYKVTCRSATGTELQNIGY
jgi:hypothetical protein